ncbi:hypothetical protein B0T11DRAFT_283271 [Plectosphaerella cucumerina]|uniref:Uncharacterized protein n=1 Tax=Plectosphaerella cucumerina TaxID=40658 RepID=A0A8K0TBE0_9PEZI|nr:hypothetical protein B0T11DRAFT_283271 [Plectosphaerella cucumerina]
MAYTSVARTEPDHRPVVISGPPGVGKSTLCRKLRDAHPGIFPMTVFTQPESRDLERTRASSTTSFRETNSSPSSTKAPLSSTQSSTETSMEPAGRLPTIRHREGRSFC